MTRNCTTPTGTSLFVGLLNAEASDLESLGTTEAEQGDHTKSQADHIVGLFCTVDGVIVRNLNTYGCAPSQFTFTAPIPWLFGAIGGLGKAVADGYCLMLAPLSAGKHTVHFGGSLHFTLANDGFDADFPLDMTYNLAVN